MPGTPAHSGAESNEQADRYAKEATGAGPLETVQEGYVDERSLSHMTRVATESRAREDHEPCTYRTAIQAAPG